MSHNPCNEDFMIVCGMKVRKKGDGGVCGLEVWRRIWVGEWRRV